jgi:hypothetical protein
MVADTRAELLATAARLGVAERHLQRKGQAKEHFDVGLSKRADALKLGVRPITQKQLIRIIQKRHDPQELHRYQNGGLPS